LNRGPLLAIVKRNIPDREEEEYCLLTKTSYETWRKAMKVENDKFRKAQKAINDIKSEKKTIKETRDAEFTDRDPPQQSTYYKPTTENEIRTLEELLEEEQDERGRLDQELNFGK
jgi:hypothetical protein